MRSLFVGIGLVALLGLGGCSKHCDTQFYETGADCRFFLDHGAPYNNPSCVELLRVYDECPEIQNQYPLAKRD
jgi:hypothetical protein